MSWKQRLLSWCLVLLAVLNIAGTCDTEKTYSSTKLTIVSGSENKMLEDLIQEFAERKRTTIQVEYQGSVDISNLIRQGTANPYDAVWPANSIWINLGDTQGVIKHTESILRSPVVFGVRQSKAQELGWNQNPVTVADILTAAESGQLKFAMTSATQSNSGASAYLGFLSAFAESPDVLLETHLQQSAVVDRVKRLLKTIDRSSGSSGWLKDLMLESREGQYDAMVNYEAMVIEYNQHLGNREPLCAVYPVDGLVVADSPLGYVNKGDVEKEQLFQELKAYLLSDAVQNELIKRGRRAGGLFGFDSSKTSADVFNPGWCIDVDRTLTSVRVPSQSVIEEALLLYQERLRKPSFTAYVLDYSGSMADAGEADMKAAMALLLDQTQAQEHLLQPTPRDIHLVIPFNGAPIGIWQVQGNDPQELKALLTKIQQLPANGGTDIYSPTGLALELIATADVNLQDYFPAVILMTDGKSEMEMNDLFNQHPSYQPHQDIPVFGIAFGNAHDSQLREITNFARGRLFDGKRNLVHAFKQAKGYN